MSRSALRLAALASSAVPGLDPVSVEGHPTRAGDLYELAFVVDSQDRHWVVKAGRTAAAGVLLEDVGALLALLARRLEVTVPVVRGVAAMPTGRAVVHARVPGQALALTMLPPGPLAADVGRTLAHIHNLEPAVFEEAGRVGYDADSHRRRTLSELDRASATGHVPPALLSRWETRLEDVSLWRFLPTPVHGGFIGSHVLASFDDPEDAGVGRVRGVIGWEESRVGDPADDLAALVAEADAATLDSVLEAYVQSRIDRPDANLVTRARLAAEMAPVRALLRAVSAGETGLVEQLADRLRALEQQVRRAEELAEARRLRAERRAREEREQARAAQAAAPAAAPPTPANGPFEGERAGRPTSSPTTGPFDVAAPGTAGDEATQPVAPPGSANGPFEGERAGRPTSSPTNGPFEGGNHGTDQADGDPDALDDSYDAADDSHEGASDFVPVDPRRPRAPDDDSLQP